MNAHVMVLKKEAGKVFKWRIFSTQQSFCVLYILALNKSLMLYENLLPALYSNLLLNHRRQKTEKKRYV